MSVLQNFGLIVLVALSAVVYLDVNNHGSFKASKTHLFLKETGVLKYSEEGFTKFRHYCQEIYRWSQNNMPEYISRTRKDVTPFLVKVKDALISGALLMYKNLMNVGQYVTEKKPVVTAWINERMPGALDTLSLWLSYVWTLLVKYYTLLLQKIQDVFVGDLSPENLQKYTMEALNTTRALAAQTITWINNMFTVTSTA